MLYNSNIIGSSVLKKMNGMSQVIIPNNSTINQSNIPLDNIIKQLELLSNRTKHDINKDLHDSACEMAYNTIPEMFMPVEPIILNGKINNVPVKILVDTGAYVSAIFSGSIDKIKMRDVIGSRESRVCFGIGTAKSP